MRAPAPLAELQNWMMRAIASNEQDLVAPADRVLPSQAQSSSQRLAIYQHAYLARLQECLREVFPVLQTTLGRDAFDQFAAEYVHRHPPASYTLNHLAHHFVDYLKATRPSDVPSPSWPDFLIELARLERTIGDVFDGPGSEDSPPLDVSELAKGSPEHWSELQVAPVPCLRLLKFAFPINDYYSEVKQVQSPSWPEPRPTWLAITRRNYIVRRVPLEQAEYHLLDGLVAGQSVGEALSASGAAAEQVADWFAAWGRLQFFSRVNC